MRATHIDRVGLRRPMYAMEVRDDAVVWATHDAVATVDLDTGARQRLRRRDHRDRATRASPRFEPSVSLEFLDTGPVARVHWLDDGSVLSYSRGRWRGRTPRGEPMEADESMVAPRSSRGLWVEAHEDYIETAPYQSETTAIVTVHRPDGAVAWSLERAQGVVPEVRWLADALWVGWSAGPQLHDPESGAVLDGEAPDLSEPPLPPEVLDARSHARVILEGNRVTLFDGEGPLGTTDFADDPVTAAAVHPHLAAALIGTTSGRLYLVDAP